MPTSVISKSRNHRITTNPNYSVQHPYRLLWDVPRQGRSLGMPVTMHRDSNLEGAREFANRWGVKLPPNVK